jgi:uncharacterized protein (TIGR03435 family)
LITIGALFLFTATIGSHGSISESIAPIVNPQTTSNGTDAPSLRFEVATIKPTQPGKDNGDIRVGQDRISLGNQSLRSFVALAFDIHDKQIVGIPQALDGLRFDIEGTTSLDHAPRLAEFRVMFQNLLKNRFSFKFHWEQRELPIYSLTVAANGPHLVTHPDPGSGLPIQAGGGNATGARTRRFENNSMDDLVFGLQSYLDRPIENDTGLKGRYDFTLTWAPVMSDDTALAPGLPTALKDQLGLKLTPAKKLTRVLIVDQIDQPSAN